MKVTFDIDVTDSKTAEDAINNLIESGGFDKIFKAVKEVHSEGTDCVLTFSDQNIGLVYGATMTPIEDKLQINVFHKPVNKTFQEVNATPSL